MKSATLLLGLRRSASGRTDRGSAIILVLVSMVLMAILAGSLLQLTRFERIPRSESNIEVVIESVINEILNQATEDLLDDAGNYLNASNAVGGYDEPFDFPWTNAAVTGERTFDDIDGNPVIGIRGGRMDDTWLAAHMPDFGTPGAGSVYAGGGADGTNGVWRKITSLTGLYLRGGTDSNLATGTFTEDAVTFTTANNRDMNINTTSPLLVDADGDGIGDSRWEWAPLRQVGATQYVMAVRIVDLSARMDMNVAIGSTPSTGSPALSSEDPRGDGPTELDGSGFVQLLANTAGSGVTLANAQFERRKVLDFLQTGNASAAGVTNSMPYDNNNANPLPGTRRDFWTDGASRVSNTFARNGEIPGGGYDYSADATFGLIDAFELLQGNGVGSANATTAENLMPNFLRRDAGQEGNFATGTPPRSWTQRQFWELDPRKHMSPFTGSAISAKPTTAAGQPRELKVDVNRAVETGSLNAITTAILRATDANLAALYPHLSEQALAEQLTANIADYMDDDNHLTKVGTTRIGFEALPYITEVYIQRPYTVTAAAAGTDPLTGDPVNNVTWSPATGSTTGYAIEIGNPFGRYDGSAWHGRPVKLTDVWLKIGTNAAERLTDFAGMPNELAAGEVVIVYLNSSGGDGTLDNIATNLLASTPGPATIAAQVDATNTRAIADGTNVMISLHAQEQNTTTNLGWYYSGCRVDTAGAAINESIPSGDGDFAAVVGDTTYIQTSYVGIGQGLNMMTVHPQPLSANARGFGDSVLTLTEPRQNRNDATGVAELTAVTPVFTLEDKPGAPPKLSALLDDQQIVWSDSKRANGTAVGRMHWIGDILQIPLIGANYTAANDLAKTMAQAFINADATGTITTAGVNALLLPYQATTPVVNGTANSGVLNYPQGLLILEQLTTFSPASDGENGDGSTPPGAESVTAPNDDEVLVPGRLNLNTSPRETLVRLLPFPDLTTRQNVADAIIARRESMTQSTNFGVGADNIPGVAYTAAIYEQIENLGVNPSRVAGDTSTLNGTRIDLNDYENTLGDYVPADNVINDREEEIMLAKWLTEVAETRSDVFAAYIVVQGYPADNFSEGASESARLIVIFSRANVKGTGDKAVEIGRFRIN